MTHRILRTLVAALAIAPLSAPVVFANDDVSVNPFSASSGAGAPPVPDVVEFNKHVRPILSNSCYACHGPDKNTREGGLRLDVREEALKERESGAAVVPGNPAASLLVQRVHHPDADKRMPPPSSERTVLPEQIAILEKWIAQGAEYEPHWAYIAPQRPSVPLVNDGGWGRNAIDNFVYRNLARDGRRPSPDADKVTLVRRVYFDLTGLPPTPEQVDAFVNDPSPNAYEKVVDKLLASPHYGERMAVDWLDQVRYADSNGYHSDEFREMYPYRDYVIDAFNGNKPFDEFTREQLAGDLFPNPTREERVASGFNRLNQITAEGGAQAKEYLAMYAADRVRAVGSVWMGATMGCAECHDHKFDPITMKDFYSMEAFFADVKEVGVYPSRGPWEPYLRLPTDAEMARESELDERIVFLREAVDMSNAELAEGRAAWESETRMAFFAGATPAWMPVTPASATSENGATLRVLPDASVLAQGDDPERDTYTFELHTSRTPITGLRIEALNDESFAKSLSRATDYAVLSEVEVSVKGTPVPFASIATNAENDEYPSARAIDGDATTGWLINTPKGDDPKAVAALTFAEPIVSGPGTTLSVTLRFNSTVARTAIGRPRLSLTTADDVALELEPGIPEHVYAAVLVDARERSEFDTAAINAYYRVISPEIAQVKADLAATIDERRNHINGYTTTLVTEAVEPRTIRILPRGDWMDDSGEVVEPATPEFLPALNVQDRRANRLDLAKWLMAPENPLTARVFVNRLWTMYFGTGLSKVLDDLGAQGEWPAYAELLDWLAVEFRESGWDVKHMVRTIVTSSTYRQSSNATKDLREYDPYNRKLARQTRLRLEAEAVRDNALAISGLLVPTIGGRSVRPYQPEGYYANLNFPKREYQTDTGDNLYRRGLYTHWQRSFLHPSLMAFDAPSREECTAQRVVSNTPLQALTLLNDPIYVEAARVFAERIVREGGDGVDERLDFAFREALSRTPSAFERDEMGGLFARHLAHFEARPEDARGAISVGEAPVPDDLEPSTLAAWTSVARVVLNLHETITRN